MNEAAAQKLTQEQLVFMLASDGLLNTQQKAEIRLKSKRHIGEHPIRQIGELGLVSAADPAKSLTSEYLTKWLAEKYELDYLRIDPLKIDVDLVASVMSFSCCFFTFLISVNALACESWLSLALSRSQLNAIVLPPAFLLCH